MSAGSRVLVTGADGFIGSHLTEALVRRAHVSAPSCSTTRSIPGVGWIMRPKRVRDSFEVFAGDIRDPHGVRTAMKGCDAVLHLAALIAIPYSYHSPDTYVDTNVKGTLNVVQAARELGVAAGRAHVDERGLRHGALRADHRGASAAGPVAVLGEQDRRGPDRDVLPRVVRHAGRRSLRPFNTYGPRQSARAVIPTIITQIASGKRQIRLGALHPTRDFNYVARHGRAASSPRCDRIAASARWSISAATSRSRSATLRALIAEVMGATIEIVTDEARLRPAKQRGRAAVGATTARRSDCSAGSPRTAARDGFRRGLAETVEWFTRTRPTSRATSRTSTTSDMNAAVTSLHADSAQVVEAISGRRGTVRSRCTSPSSRATSGDTSRSASTPSWVSSVGTYVDRFEAELAAFTGARPRGGRRQRHGGAARRAAARRRASRRRGARAGAHASSRPRTRSRYCGADAAFRRQRRATRWASIPAALRDHLRTIDASHARRRCVNRAYRPPHSRDRADAHVRPPGRHRRLAAQSRGDYRPRRSSRTPPSRSAAPTRAGTPARSASSAR